MAAAEGQGIVARFDGVGLSYERESNVLSDVSFELRAESFCFLTGPSGAGKTSLLRLLYLANKPSQGSMQLFGHDIAKTPRKRLPELRRRIGVVFQDFRLLEHLSVFDNVALPLRIVGHPETEVRRYVSELLSWVGLKNHLSAPAPSLSGGQQQLAAIARAVIGRPKLILADEPTGNVDEPMEVRLMNLFQELNRLGATVVVATHSLRLARSLGHRRLRVEDGRVWEDNGTGAPNAPNRSATGAEALNADRGGTA